MGQKNKEPIERIYEDYKRLRIEALFDESKIPDLKRLEAKIDFFEYGIEEKLKENATNQHTTKEQGL